MGRAGLMVTGQDYVGPELMVRTLHWLVSAGGPEGSAQASPQLLAAPLRPPSHGAASTSTAIVTRPSPPVCVHASLFFEGIGRRILGHHMPEWPRPN